MASFDPHDTFQGGGRDFSARLGLAIAIATVLLALAVILLVPR
jgi:hypothetical protein